MRDIDISRFLSLVLRHKPETAGIELDPQGWVDVKILIQRINEHGIQLNREMLDHIVATNPKKRFAYNENCDRIRASQGHSVEVDLGYVAQKPPDILYHGTGEKWVESILKTGLEKKSRSHVHLSADHETAKIVGSRHGKPFIFLIRADEMHAAGFQFFLSENGVWLTDKVPVNYISDNGQH